MLRVGPVVAPGELATVGAARRELPLRLAREATARSGGLAERVGHLPVDAVDRVLRLLVRIAHVAERVERFVVVVGDLLPLVRDAGALALPLVAARLVARDGHFVRVDAERRERDLVRRALEREVGLVVRAHEELPGRDEDHPRGARRRSGLRRSGRRRGRAKGRERRATGAGASRVTRSRACPPMPATSEARRRTPTVSPVREDFPAPPVVRAALASDDRSAACDARGERGAARRTMGARSRRFARDRAHRREPASRRGARSTARRPSGSAPASVPRAPWR